jgi:GDPmannose 4,6-dehydratase
MRFIIFAAQSHVRVSFDTPQETAEAVGMGTLKLLEAIRNVNPNIKLYQASSSEMFGDNPNVPFNEESVLCQLHLTLVLKYSHTI